MKINLSRKNIFGIITSALLALAHIATIAIVVLSYKYYGIYPSIFYSALAIVVCLLIIIDFIFVVGFNHKDLTLKIISCVLAVFILLGGTIGTFVISDINGKVNSVLGKGEDKYESFSGTFVALKSHGYQGLDNLENKRIGMINESSNGLAYIAKTILDEQGFDYATVDTYSSTTELLQALIDGDIHCAVVTSAYREIYENDENSNMKDYLDDLSDIYTFTKDLKIESNKKKKNLMKEPFNVLLIGWSRTEIGSTVGLADAIIVATINPQTYTVSMMSIARDSFVPISCYGGAYDKINSGRSTSRQCFIETVEDFIGMDIDYYMEADYGAIIRIVNCIGGVEIDNPVDFELDGVFVPAGKYVAEGWQALEFCRERHHMPNGDFDRQKHQKEVILAIARKFIESGDINLALNAMKQASDFLDTDFTLQELSTVFNLLLNTKNYTSLDTFDLVDFHTLRITGNGGLLYYSYSMHLPLWVYLIYQGSYDESISHIYDVMGKYDVYDQVYSFEFSGQNPYVRSPFYSLDYESKYVYSPDPIPAYWPTLTGMTLAEAMAWATENGVALSVSEVITGGDPRYNAELDGLVYSQSVRYGSLVSENHSGSVVMMGSGEIDDTKFTPNFVGHNYEKFVEWADRVGVRYSIDFDTHADSDYKIGDVVSQSYPVGTRVDAIEKIKVVVRAGTYTIKFDLNGYGSNDSLVAPEDMTVTTGDEAIALKTFTTVTEADGKRYRFLGWFTQSEGGTEVKSSVGVSTSTTLYAQWEFDCEHNWVSDETKTDVAPTCTTAGVKYEKCTICEKTREVEVQATGHSWIEDGDPAPAPDCTTAGSQNYKCSNEGCSETKTETLNPLGHNYVADNEEAPTSWECSRCGDTVTENPN